MSARPLPFVCTSQTTLLASFIYKMRGWIGCCPWLLLLSIWSAECYLFRARFPIAVSIYKFYLRSTSYSFDGQKVIVGESSIIKAHNSNSTYISKKAKKPWTGSKYTPVKKFMRSETTPINDTNQDLFVEPAGSTNMKIARAIIKNVRQLVLSGNPKAAYELLMKEHLTYIKELSSLLVEFNMLIKELGDRGELQYCGQVLSLMRSWGMRPSVVTYSTLISRAGAWKKVALAESYFQEMIRDGIKADVQAYNSLINAYAKDGDSRRAVDVLERMEAMSVRPSIVTFNTLIDSCARSGDTNSLNAILKRLECCGLTANSRTYSSLIHACCQAGEVDRAFQYLAAMRSNGFEPTEITFSSLLHGCGAMGDITRAFQLLDLMKFKGIRPNVVTMSSIIHACGKHGQLDLAFSLYEEMLNSTSADGEQFRPNSITCSSLVDICLKEGHVEKAFGIISDMRTRGIPLTEVTYASLITELSRLGQLERILEVFMGEPNEGIPPSLPQKRYGNAVFPTSAKTIAIDADSDQGDSAVAMDVMWLLTEAEKVDAALEVLRRQREPGQGISQADGEVITAAEHSAQQLLKAADNIGEICRFSRERESRIRPNNQTISLYEKAAQLLVRGYVKAGNLLKAIRWLCERNPSVQSGNIHAIGPGLGSVELGTILKSSLGYTELLNRFKTSSNHNAVLVVFESMRRKGVEIGTDAYQTLMSSIYENAAQSAAGSDSLVSIARTSSANSLRKQQMRHDELFRLYLVFQEMKIAGVQPDTAVYNTLINACAGSGEVDKALESLRSMRTEGLEPDIITYTSLIKACMIHLPTIMHRNCDESAEVKVSAIESTVALAEDLFSAMQQRTNHFSTYIAPNELTYQRLIQTHWTAVTLLINSSHSNNHSGNALPLHVQAHLTRIWSLYEAVRSNGMSPGVQGYGCCVRAARLQQNIAQGLQVLEHIRADPAMLSSLDDYRKGKAGFDLKCWQIVASLANVLGLVTTEQQLLKEINAEIS